MITFEEAKTRWAAEIAFKADELLSTGAVENSGQAISEAEFIVIEKNLAELKAAESEN